MVANTQTAMEDVRIGDNTEAINHTMEGYRVLTGEPKEDDQIINRGVDYGIVVAEPPGYQESSEETPIFRIGGVENPSKEPSGDQEPSGYGDQQTLSCNSDRPTTTITSIRPLDEGYTHFIFDFDGTITTKDTINNIADFGIAHKHHLGKAGFEQIWSQVLTRYLEDLHEHIEKYEPIENQRLTTRDEIDWLRSLKDVEMRSINRVNNSRVFEGISKELFEQAGRVAVSSKEVEIRGGFKELVQGIEKRNGAWGIVSCNFSADFIRGVLAQCLGKSVDIPIVSNSIDEDGFIRGPVTEETGVRSACLITSDTKLSAMQKMLDSWKLDENAKAVYYGDSPTDMECLLSPAVRGVIVADGESSLLRSLCKYKKHWQCTTFTSAL